MPIFTPGETVTANELNQWCSIGLDANKGTPTVVGEAYIATDTGKIYYTTNGTSWNQYVAKGFNNILRGIVPTASYWSTTPSNLANCTDGSLSAATGTGSRVVPGPVQQSSEGAIYGTITFDLGSIKTVLLGARVGMWRTSSQSWTGVYLYFDAIDVLSTNHYNWRFTTNSQAASHSTTERVIDTVPRISTGRYHRLRFDCDYATATGYAKIYEVYAFEVT